MKNQVGIWLDQKQAYLIGFKDGNANVKTIASNIEDYHVVGGARSKTPWGPMDVVSEKKSLERHKHQLNNYFQEIMKELKGSDELYLFGPAETRIKLRDAIQNNKAVSFKVVQVEVADNMTERQMIAQVRKVFNMKPSKG